MWNAIAFFAENMWNRWKKNIRNVIIMVMNKFIPGETYVPVSGKVFDEEEINNAISAARDGWWTEGNWAKEFEREFKKFLKINYVSLVNSGSSANLVALASLTSSVFGDRRLKAGDEFITCSVAFPTTVNPGLQYGLKPIFIDAELDTLNIDVDQIEKAITKKTKLIMVAHTLGKPYNLKKIMKIAKKYNLWVIEDCCDALGSKYDGKLVSSFGDIATFSFYPAHQMSCSFNTPIPYLDEKGSWNMEPIEKIYETYINDSKKIKVLSFDKNNKVSWSTPSAILRHKLGAAKKMFKITTQHGRSVEVTEDHSVFVIDQETADIVPKEARQIMVDDFIVTTNNIPANYLIKYIDTLKFFKNKDTYISNFSVENLKSIKNRDYAWQYKSRNALPIKYLNYYDLDKENLFIGISQSNKIPIRIVINEELCRLLGYYMAEGSYQNGLIFSFNKNETDLIKDVVAISKSQFNIIPSVGKSRNNEINVEIQSKNVEIVFREVFKIEKGAKNKRIPWFMFHTDETCVKAFIYGYTSGDGSIRILEDNTNRIDVTSVSKDLLNDFQYLLSKVGISASFYRRNKAHTSKKIKGAISSNNENYTLNFSGYIYGDKTIVKQNIKDRNNFADQIPLLPVFRKYINISKDQQIISKKRLLKYLESNKKLYKLVNSDLSFLKVRSVEKISYDKDQYVYDFSVPGNENFYGGFLGIFLHNTMGEGGAVVTNNSLIHKSIRQFRDWGRDCWCDTGKDNTCRKRFGWKLGQLPQGYDHKYIYSQIGYNLKTTDFQAAIGCAQLKKLPYFIKKRQENYGILYDFFKQYKKYFILMKNDKNEEVSYFGFPIIVKPTAPFTRNQLTEYLEKNKIGTRNIFSGNLLRHPAYINLKKNFKIIGDHKNADLIMSNAFWLGVYPGITKEMMNYVKEKIKEFIPLDKK